MNEVDVFAGGSVTFDPDAGQYGIFNIPFCNPSPRFGITFLLDGFELPPCDFFILLLPIAVCDLIDCFPSDYSFTIGADTNPIRPSGTGGTNSTTVTIRTDPPTPNQSLTLKATAPDPTSGGHINHSGARPTGSFAASQGTTDGNGVFQTTYTASDFGGTINLTVTMGGASATEVVNVFVDGLLPLIPSVIYVQVGATSTHPINHYGTETATINLIAIAGDYLDQFPDTDITNGVLRYNDMSLIYGGKFDLDNAWGTSAHAEHRIGINCDVYSGNVPSDRWTALTDIFRARHSPNFGDETATRNHWHLRFDQ